MSDDILKHHDKCLSQLSPLLVDKAVKHLRSVITLEDAIQIRNDWIKDPKTWWAIAHHWWGMGIRNSLRDSVCSDSELPSGNWDDYYVPLVEMACGLRKYGHA